MTQQSLDLGDDIGLDLFRYRLHIFLPGEGVFSADIHGDQQIGYYFPHRLHDEEKDKAVKCHQYIDLQGILDQISDEIDRIRDIVHHIRIQQ